jgi:hypothetical protein
MMLKSLVLENSDMENGGFCVYSLRWPQAVALAVFIED